MPQMGTNPTKTADTQRNPKPAVDWEVFVTPGIPIITRDRPVGVRETFFQAMASTLIYGNKDAVLVDARTDLSSARGLCRLLSTAGRSVPVLAVVSEGGLVAVSADWGLDEILLPGVTHMVWQPEIIEQLLDAHVRFFRRWLTPCANAVR